MKRILIAGVLTAISVVCGCVVYADVPTQTTTAEQAQEPVMHISEYEDEHENEKIDAALDWHYIDDVTLTAYCPCVECCGKDNGITATGTQAQQGVTIAVDPDVIPLGAWVEIDGHMFHAEDVGGGVGGNHIDVYYNSHEMASAFGVKVRDVRWYE